MVLQDTSITTQAVCEKYHGARWLKDIEGGICMALYRSAPLSSETDYLGCDVHGGPPEKNPPQLYYCKMLMETDEKFDKLHDFYKIDLETYYRATYNCAKNGNGKPDTEHLPLVGTPPVSLYLGGH